MFTFQLLFKERQELVVDVCVLEPHLLFFQVEDHAMPLRKRLEGLRERVVLEEERDHALNERIRLLLVVSCVFRIGLAVAVAAASPALALARELLALAFRFARHGKRTVEFGLAFCRAGVQQFRG